MAEQTKITMAIPMLDDFDTWNEYEDCIDLWALTTKVEPKQRGAVLAMTIPVNSTKWGDNLRKGMFQVVKPKTLGENANGVKLIMDYLREKLAPTDECLIIDLFNKIIVYKRKPGQSYKEYVSEFDMLYNQCISQDIPFHDTIIAFLLLHNAGMNSIEYKLVITNLSISESVGKLYKTLKDRMINLLTNSMGNVVQGGIATADVHLAEEQHDVLISQGWRPPKKDIKYKGYNKVSTN